MNFLTDMCPKPNDTQTELSKTSYVEELADGVPGLFAALTSDPDPQQRWLSITYPIDFDLSAYRAVPEKTVVFHLRKYLSVVIFSKHHYGSAKMTISPILYPVGK